MGIRRNHTDVKGQNQDSAIYLSDSRSVLTLIL